MRKAAWGLLLLFVFTIPWEYSLDLGAPFGNIARVMGLAVLLVAVAAVLREGQFRRLGHLQWLTLAFYLWFCCSFFWTIAPDATLLKLRGYPQEMMLVWLVWELADSPDDLRNLLRAWLAGSWVLAILTLADLFFLTAAGADQTRFAAIGQDPNDVARFLDFGFPIAALLLYGREEWFGRVLAVGYFPIGFAGVLLTASRSGFLVALVALAGCGVLVFQRYPKRLFAGLLGLPILGGIVWGVAPRGTLERLGTIVEQLQGGDLNQRVNIWSAGWHAFLHAPVLGQGAGSFVRAAGLAPIDTAHNTVLAIVVEGGLCALALATAIILGAIHSVRKTQGAIRIGLITLLAVWFVASLVGTVGENRTTWLLLGVIALSYRLTEENADAVDAAFPCPGLSPGFETVEWPE